MAKESKRAAAEKQLRVENYERQRAQLLAEGYTEHSGVISVLKANVMAFVTAGPFALAAVLLYAARWGGACIRLFLDIRQLLVFLGLLLLSIPVHELIHGLTWLCCCKNGWRSIHFGVMWEMLTPYCHCMEPMRFGGYICGGLMPFFLLGVCVSAAAIISGSVLLLVLGAFNILAAGGDTTIALMLLRYRDALILDHPTECGFVAFRRGE